MTNINIDQIIIHNMEMNMQCDEENEQGTIPNNSFYIFPIGEFPRILAAADMFSSALALQSINLGDELQLWTFFFLGGTTYGIENNFNSFRYLATMNNMPNTNVILAENTDNPNNRWDVEILLDLELIYTVRLKNVVNNEYFVVGTNMCKDTFTTTPNKEDATVFVLVGLPFLAQTGII